MEYRNSYIIENDANNNFYNSQKYYNYYEMDSKDDISHRSFNASKPSTKNSIMFFEKDFERMDNKSFGDQLVLRTLKYMNADVSTVYVPTSRLMKDQRTLSDSDLLSAKKKYPNDMPSESEISKKFYELVESMNLSTEYRQQLMSTSISHKWALLKGQESVSEGRHSVAFYMCQLERHLDPQIARNPTKKMLKGLYTIESLLTSLEVDLRSNPNATWLREFIDEPNCGHVVLLKMLKHIQDRSHLNSNNDKGTYSKMKRLDVILAKEPNEEHLCVLCIKAITRNKYGFHKILSAPRSLSTMAWCLRLSNLKTRMAVIKIFSEACEHAVGFEKTLQALEDYKQYKQEKFRFQCLVHSVIYGGRTNNLTYQECVIHFFNTIIHNSPSLNQRVFHQQELEAAGFTAERVEQCLGGLRAENVREELGIWRNNYVDVATTLDEFVALRGRSVLLRDEVDYLQGKLEEVGREKSKLFLEKKELERKVEDYKLRASEVHGQIEIIRRNRSDNPKTQMEIQQVLETAVEDILRPGTPIEQTIVKARDKSEGYQPSYTKPTRTKKESSVDVPDTVTVEESSTSNPAAPPPPPPPVPPPPPPSGPNGANNGPFQTSSARLPMLNWQPIQAPSEDSIFMQCQQEMDMVDGLDFSELDSMFALKQTQAPKHTMKRQAALQKLSDQITVLNSNKARNLLIARKRISLSPEELRKAITTCDIVSLSPESAELLLKFIPTNDERSALLKCSEDFESLGDAEKFLFQLLQVERLEAKLNTIAFMGAFDEIFRSVSPQIEAIITGCVTVSTSAKLKKIIGLILTYGNYINGGRRGIVQAFKLDSLTKLDDIKTNDRKTTFLQYLVGVIRQKFPDLHNFHEELEVQPALNIAMEVLRSDVQQLRKGVDLAKSEREKQPESFAIHEFYSRASLKVQNISERYRKMEEQFKEVCVLFCEDPKTTEPSSFFQSIHRFIERYKRATKEIDIRLQAEKTLQKAEQLKQQQTKYRKKSTPAMQNNKYSVLQENILNSFNNRQIPSTQLKLMQADSMENLLEEKTLPRSHTDSKLLKTKELSKSTSYLDKEMESINETQLSNGDLTKIRDFYSKSYTASPSNILNDRPMINGLS